jgi:hypothetical protein
MKLQVLSVHSPVWSDEKKTRIECIVRFSSFSTELPFNADPEDVEEHGRDIFRRCIAGEFGEIGPYTGSRIEQDLSLQSSPPSWLTAGPEVHAFIAWPEVHAFIDEANEENARGSPRAIGLVWGSMLEVMLRNFIDCELKSAGRNWKSLRCPSDNSPRGRKCGNSFSDLINAAVHERFIDEDHGKRLHAVREIRNACAHEWRFSFDNLNVSGLKPQFEFLRLAYFPEFLGTDLEGLMKMVYSPACCANLILFAQKST